MRRVRFVLVLVAIMVGGVAFASSASASSVGIPAFSVYDGSTQVSPATAPAGSKRGFWIQIKFTNGLTAGQKINITGPVGSTFSTNPSHYLLNLPGAAVLASSATALNGGRGVALTVPSGAPSVAANDSRYVTFGGGAPSAANN